MRKDPSPQNANAPSRVAFELAVVLCLLAAGGISARPVSAQTPASQTSTPGSAARPVHRHKRPSPPPSVVFTQPAVSAPVAPPVPQTPNWPAFDKAAEASIVWDSHGLTIDAANSSLEQILKDIATSTGAKIEGLGADQRVFGDYGPGQARDVLAQLLQGSGYNVIMIGDQGQGAPRQVLLSVRQNGPMQPSAKPATTAASNEEDEAEEPAAIVEPVQGRPGFTPGVPPRSPQQIMQEMQQRQQQMGPQGQPQPGQPQPNNPQN